MLCNYSCTTDSDLKKHIMVHSEEKPFVCKQCNYSVTKTGDLKKHILVHSGEKPFVNKCTYSFTTASHPERDLLTHLFGGKAFQV